MNEKLEQFRRSVRTANDLLQDFRYEEEIRKAARTATRTISSTGPGTGPRIRCAVCNKLVDGVEIYDGPGGYTTLIDAFCHGEHDRMAITKEDFENGGPEFAAMIERIIGGQQEGTAFATPLIERGK